MFQGGEHYGIRFFICGQRQSSCLITGSSQMNLFLWESLVKNPLAEEIAQSTVAPCSDQPRRHREALQGKGDLLSHQRLDQQGAPRRHEETGLSRNSRLGDGSPREITFPNPVDVPLEAQIPPLSELREPGGNCKTA